MILTEIFCFQPSYESGADCQDALESDHSSRTVPCGLFSRIRLARRQDSACRSHCRGAIDRRLCFDVCPLSRYIKALLIDRIIYAGTLAYLVDSNPGRSAGAVSCNSFVRGSLACVLSQVAIPIQNGIGDGGLYTMFAALLALSCACSALIACELNRPFT